MRRLAVVIGCVALALPTAALGQSNNLDFGVIGGVSFGDVRTDDPELADTFRRNALAAGVFAVIRANERFDVVPGLMYQQQGFRIEDASDDATFEVDYITLPLLLQVNLTTTGPVRPRVFAGPSIGFETACGVSGTIDGVADDFECSDEDVDVQTASTVYAAVFGAGVAWEFGPWALGLDGRYDYGLTDLDLDPAAPTIELRTYSILASVSRGVGGG